MKRATRSAACLLCVLGGSFGLSAYVVCHDLLVSTIWKWNAPPANPIYGALCATLGAIGWLLLGSRKWNSQSKVLRGSAIGAISSLVSVGCFQYALEAMHGPLQLYYERNAIYSWGLIFVTGVGAFTGGCYMALVVRIDSRASNEIAGALNGPVPPINPRN